MLPEKMLALGKKRSAIREIFEYGKKRAKEIGADKVFDFSIGNPNVPAPQCVKEAMLDLINNEDPVLLHSYTSAPGITEVREKIAGYINARFGTKFAADHLYMTSGASSGLMICAKAMLLPGEEVITFAPYFSEYRVYMESAGGKLVVLPADLKHFQIDIDAFEAAVNKNTKAVIINSPNNPSGAIYSAETITKLSDILHKKEKEFGHVIYIIADEPYRELVYDNIEVPFIPNFYNNTVVCYSYSKSLSLPGERIGYIAVSPDMDEWQEMYAAVCGAGRACGYVCASSFFQLLVAKCVDKISDISIYKRNRDILYDGLVKLGYTCVHPDGAFYLFVKALEPDSNAFCEQAKKHEVLLVAGDEFGCPGYVRISYCVRTDQIENSLAAFAALAKDYK